MTFSNHGCTCHGGATSCPLWVQIKSLGLRWTQLGSNSDPRTHQLCLEVQEELDSSSGNFMARAGKGPRARRARSAGDEAADPPPAGWRPCHAQCCSSHWVLQHKEPLRPSQGPDSGRADRKQSLCSPHGRRLTFQPSPLPRSRCSPSDPEGVVCFFFFFFVPRYLIYTSVSMHLLDLCAYRSSH